MYALIDDVESYPDFLPWCSAAEVHSRKGGVVEATLSMSRAGIGQSFRTRNINTPYTKIEMTLVEGPFDHLQGGWQFAQLGDDGCKVSLDLQFEFENFILDTVFGHFLEASCNSLIESFTQRAQRVYD